MTSRRRIFSSVAKMLRKAGGIALLVAIAPQIASAQQADGELQFRQRCGSCHSLEADGKGAGPSLSGVIGRQAGSLEGARYSQAFRDTDLTWDVDTLDRFLSDPNKIVPGIYAPRSRRVHLKVQRPNGNALTTHMFFPNDPPQADVRLSNPKLVADLFGTVVRMDVVLV
ncbi:hypothetical protein ATER59S_00066 [Aquamicrobium terrae]